MGLSRSRRSATSYPFGLSFVSVVDEARTIPNQELPATLDESSCREAALTSILKGSKDESWKKDKESRRTEG